MICLNQIYLMKNNELIISNKIKQKIFTIRNVQAMLDSDLAELYGVSTKVLNQAVKRNISRFPKDFMFQLTEVEKEYVVANCDHINEYNSNSPGIPVFMIIV